MSTREDFNFDGRVDSADLSHILANYGQPSDGPEDLNNDGVVNAADMAELFAAWTEEPIVRLRHVSGDDQNRRQTVEEIFFLDVSPFEPGWTRVWYRHAVNKRAVSVDIPVPLPYANEVLRQRGWDPLQNSTLN